ncbi:MAG: ABC transporter ATP-binding protein [Acidobacteriota bacterium]
MTQKPSSQAVVDIDNLTKDYETGFLKKKKVRALDHLSLQIYGGEIFGFLGPNGAGKTTTLKLLMGLIYPSEGKAAILGHPIDDVNTRSRVGYLPENPYFYDYLSGRELLYYTAALFGLQKTGAQSRAAELLRAVGLNDDRADRQLRKYSKGMLQRIGIAQALINDPEIVFMDEPMSGLDPIGRREIRDLLLSLREKKKTIFFSSHILSDVESLCDRIAILTRGKLLRAGTVQEMTESERATLEIVAMGVEADQLSEMAKDISSIESVAATANGVQMALSDESAVEEAIRLIRQCGGKIVSITPRRRSLEDMFSNNDEAI